MSQFAPGSLVVACGRLYWMLVGPAVALFFAAQIVTAGSGWLTLLDACFGLSILGLMLARWIEFQSGDARTTDGQPAGERDLRRYLLFAAACGALAWLVANVVGNHLLVGSAAPAPDWLRPHVWRPPHP